MSPDKAIIFKVAESTNKVEVFDALKEALPTKPVLALIKQEEGWKAFWFSA